MLDERTRAILSRPTCDVDQVAEILDMSRPGVINAIKRGDIAAEKFGPRYVIPTAPLRKLLRIDDGMLSPQASAA